jgi:hypothetical protein
MKKIISIVFFATIANTLTAQNSCYKLVLKDIEELTRVGNYNYAEIKLNKLGSDSLCPEIDKADFAKQKLKFKKIFDANRNGFVTNFKMGEGSYTGNLKNGKREGKGKIVYTDESFYEGEFKDNDRHGIGIFKFKDGTYYKGEFKNAKLYGWGVLDQKSKGQKYDGEFLDGQKSGWGKETYKDGSFYEGEWKYGRKWGETSHFYKKVGWIENCPNTIHYCGGYINDSLWGEGRCYNLDYQLPSLRLHYSGYFAKNKPKEDYPNFEQLKQGYLKWELESPKKIKEFLLNGNAVKNATYNGTTLSGIMTGWGSIEFNISNVSYNYKGEWSGGKINGWGEFYSLGALDEINYKGAWKNGYFNGFGKLTSEIAIYQFPNSQGVYVIAYTYVGNFIDRKKDGEGRLYDENMRLIFDGKFKNDLIQFETNKVK